MLQGKENPGCQKKKQVESFENNGGSQSNGDGWEGHVEESSLWRNTLPSGDNRSDRPLIIGKETKLSGGSVNQGKKNTA